ncbi:MAG: yrrB 1, partial [Acidobacteria bacterium]|nr:yrrB 1 [Acidobacteriota bacterium]
TANVPTALPGAAGRARVGFWIVGRDQQGQREWLRGGFEADVAYPEGGPWHITTLDKAQAGSFSASVDLFSEVSAPAGLSARLPAYGTPENGGFVWKGAAAGDVNADGWIDLFVTGTTRNFLYLNEGNGRFRDASAETGVQALASGSGPLLADYDNDGDLDVFIAAVGQQVLLENRFMPDKRLRFEDVSLEKGVAVTATGFSAAAADINADGQLDFYVASYNAYGRVTPNSWSTATNGTPNLLFVSQPGGGYREEAARWGVDDKRWSYAAAFADLNDDGRPDLYVANDFGEKGLFIHQGTSFKDEARERGVLDPGNGMGVAFGDYNNDGRLDLHATNMSSTAGNRILGRMFPGAKPSDQVLVKLASGNTLFENLGGGRFREVTADVGGLSGAWAWGGGFLDVDNDGNEDLYTPNGFISGKSMKDT